MPFKSEKQRKWMHANEPEMAKDWEKKNESHKVDCPKCNGKGCDHCGGKGYHINEGKLESLALNLLRNINKETGISKYDHTKTAHFNKVMKFLRSKMRNTPDKKLGDIAMSYDQYRQKQPKATIPDIDSVKNMEKTLKKLGMKEKPIRLKSKSGMGKISHLGMESVNESRVNVLKAIKIAKSMGGNMTGAVKKIEKIQKGLSKQIEVEDALRTANESVNEAGMELNKLKDAIKMFQKKIEKQGRVTNARDEEHLSNLIKLYKQMGGKGINEQEISIKDAFKDLVKDHGSKKALDILTSVLTGGIGFEDTKKKKKFQQKLLKKMMKESVNEAERDYKAEYKKYGSSTKAKKYRAELNKYNRQKGTYGNGDGKDASHKGGKIVGFEAESKNRGRAEKSRLKKEFNNQFGSIIDEAIDGLNEYYTVDIPAKQIEKHKRDFMAIFNKMKINGVQAKDKILFKDKSHFQKADPLLKKLKIKYKVRENVNETPYELGGMKVYSKADGLKKVKSMQKTDGAKIYKVTKTKTKLYGKHPVTMYNLHTKNKNHSTRQNPYGLDMMKGVYLIPIKESVNRPDYKNHINDGHFFFRDISESTGDEHHQEMTKFILTALSKAGIKIIKVQMMKKSWLQGRWWYGGFFTVRSSNMVDMPGQGKVKRGSAVLPFYVDKKGLVNLQVSPKDWIIGKYPNMSKLVKNLKDFKKGDLEEGLVKEGSIEQRELKLYIDNDGQLYRQRYTPIEKNLTKKMQKGNYDSKLAVKLFMYLVDDGAKKYVKDFGGNVKDMFPKKDRIEVAKELVDDFEREYKVRNESESVKEKISKEEWAQYPAYARKLKPYMQKLLKIPLKVRVIKQANHNPWIEIRVAKFGQDTIPNDFRKLALKAIGGGTPRDMDNINYGNITTNSVSMLHSQWVKLLGNRVKV